MFGSDILEVAIGLILMFLLFSLLMTAARETLESMLKRRGRDLQNVLVELLGKNGDRKDSANEKAAETPLEAFQRHRSSTPSSGATR